MTTFETDSSTLHVIVVTALLGLGIAHIMPPATESIMGALPREKAGVGSAMNDTTRQVGGAVGVALLGSILSSRYGSHVSNALAGSVPPDVVERREGLRRCRGRASSATTRRRSRSPRRSSTPRSEGFVTGFHTALLVAAGILLIAAVGVMRWLPARALAPPTAMHRAPTTVSRWASAPSTSSRPTWRPTSPLELEDANRER